VKAAEIGANFLAGRWKVNHFSFISNLKQEKNRPNESFIITGTVPSIFRLMRQDRLIHGCSPRRKEFD
jgi:hypothetical protein